ncbi:AMP-binding protein [Anaerobiospirillum succiniciproducens]|uniref:AMP-binding protein n=1 Tax=Anaerobiospirillum succiniciproducens TaxID=13335 RepID=UPI003F8A7AB5
MQDKADLVVDSCESIADKLFNAINHAKDPNKTALIVKKECCSYANLRDRSFSFAALLLANKVSRIALCTGRTFDMYTTIAASIMSGVTYVPLTLINPCEKSAFICANSQSSHIFIAPEAVLYAAKMLLNMPQESLKSIDIICTNSVALELKNAVQEAIANTQ